MNINRNLPIAIIDSGIGGLSLLKEISQKYPNENYIYLADNQYMPYGNKSAKFIKTRLLELINQLYNTFDIKLVILACNTASITSLEYLNKHSPVKVMGLNIRGLTDTLESNYRVLCTKLSSKGYNDLNVYPCTRLAKDIEENIFDISTLNRKIKNVLNKANITESNIILGCTHYELVASKFKALEPNKNFILPCREFVKDLHINKPNIGVKGDILMISTLATKSYIDKLWKIFKS